MYSNYSTNSVLLDDDVTARCVQELYPDAVEQLEAAGLEFEADDVLRLCLLYLEAYDPMHPDDWSWALEEFISVHSGKMVG